MKREQAESALFSPEKTIVNTSALHPSSSSKVKRIFTQVDFHPRLKRVFTQSSRGSSHKAQEDLHIKLKSSAKRTVNTARYPLLSNVTVRTK